MPIQLASGIVLDGYDSRKKSDVDSLESMYTGYLLEEFQRLGEMAFGNPVADYLATSIIRCESEDAGFMSLDAGLYAVEVIYVKPAFRGRRLATMVLAESSRACPQTLALKTPLSPGGEALRERLGLARADNYPHEVAKNEEALRTILESIKKGCPHGRKRSGDPRKPCRRCYQNGLRRYATYVIGMNATGKLG